MHRIEKKRQYVFDSEEEKQELIQDILSGMYYKEIEVKYDVNEKRQLRQVGKILQTYPEVLLSYMVIARNHRLEMTSRLISKTLTRCNM